MSMGYGSNEIPEPVYEHLKTPLPHSHIQVNAVAARLAAMLTDVLPEALSHIFFFKKASEAIENALKMARHCGRKALLGQN